MPKAQFPSRRFRGVGFTREEVAELQGAFDRSDRTVQRLDVDHLKSLSSAKLKDYGRARLSRMADRGARDAEKVEALTEASRPLSKVSDELDETGEDSSTPEA